MIRHNYQIFEIFGAGEDRQPIWRKTAANGHFGRDDIEIPWECTEKAEALNSAARL